MVTRSEDAFKLLFHAAPDAILVVDGSGRIRLNNTEAERLLDAAFDEDAEKGIEARLKELMAAAHPILDQHPVNRRRRAEGKLPANGLWFWAEGRAIADRLCANLHAILRAES